MKVCSCKVATNQIISMKAIWLLVVVMITWWKNYKRLERNDGSLMRLMMFPCVYSHISATKASRNRVINAGFLHRKCWSSRTSTLGRMRRVSGNILMNPGLRTSWITRGSSWNRRTSCCFLQVQEKVQKRCLTPFKGKCLSHTDEHAGPCMCLREDAGQQDYSWWMWMSCDALSTASVSKRNKY